MNSGMLVLVAILCAAVGFVVGALVIMLFTGKGQSDNPSPQPPARQQDRPMQSQGVRLARDLATGTLLVELDGRILPGPASLKPEERGKLERACGDLAAWLAITPPSGATGPALVTPRPAAQTAVRAAAAREIFPRTPAPSVEPIPAVPFQPVKSTVDAPRPAPTMVMQIDVILQEMAAKSPLANRGIRITEEPREGVVVWVGSTRYQGIDSVSDPEVLALIRGAVAEWERRAEAGM
jgi:hypothetical protein